MSQTSALRISGGEHRGRRVPLPRNTELRPTSEKARQAFFDILGPSIEGAAFLDLFAGTGVFAMEALSRGASKAVAVESSRRAAEQIRKTSETIGLPVEIVVADVYRSASRLEQSGPFDVVYADPPYGDDRWEQILSLGDSTLLAANGLVALEHWTALTDQIPSGAGTLTRYRVARYGTVAISLYERETTE